MRPRPASKRTTPRYASIAHGRPCASRSWHRAERAPSTGASIARVARARDEAAAHLMYGRAVRGVFLLSVLTASAIVAACTRPLPPPPAEAEPPEASVADAADASV